MVTRVFVEKRKGFDVEARHMMADLRQNLGLKAIEDLRILNRYDVSGLSGEEFEAAAIDYIKRTLRDHERIIFNGDGYSEEWVEEAARRGQLDAYRHNGFWQCMDTMNEKKKLEEMWRSGNAPWKVWE